MEAVEVKDIGTNLDELHIHMGTCRHIWSSDQQGTEPGIASFAQHPSRAGESLKPLVDYMMQTLKHDALLAKSIVALQAKWLISKP